MLKPFLYFLLGVSLVAIPCFSYALDCSSGYESISNGTTYSSAGYGYHDGYLYYHSGSVYNYVNSCRNLEEDSLPPGGASFIYTYDYYVTSASSCDPDNGIDGNYYRHRIYKHYIPAQCTELPETEPTTCSNGDRDGDETGIDCGGSCTSECVNYCPDGTQPVPTYNGGQIVSYGCANIQDNKNSFGSCPSGWFPSSDGNGCVESLTVLLVQPSASQEYIDSFTDPTVEGSSGLTTGTFSQTEFYTPETVVDNGDGTETVKLTKITTGSDGSSTSSTTTLIRPSGSSSGTGFTADGTPAPGYEGTTDTDEEKPGEATVGSTERAELPDISDAINSGIDQSFATFNDFIDDVKNSELSDVFTNIMTPPADSSGSDVLSVDMGSYGSQTIDFTSSQGLYDILGGVLQTCAFITGAYIVFRKQ